MLSISRTYNKVLTGYKTIRGNPQKADPSAVSAALPLLHFRLETSPALSHVTVLAGQGHSSPDIDEVQKREGVGGFGGGYSGPQSAPGDDASPREGKNHRAGTQAPEGNVHPNLPERGSAGPSGRSDDPHASFDTGLQHNDRTANDPGPLTGAP
jgi:hypothetical protein